jgi:hypothetical protein
MRRVFWTMAGVGLGAALAIVAYRRMSKTKEAFTPEGVSRGIDKALAYAEVFAHDVQAAAAQREQELRSALLTDEAQQARPRSKASDPTRNPTPRSRAVPGGLRDSDMEDPLYDF